MYRQAKELTVGLLSPGCPQSCSSNREWWELCFVKGQQSYPCEWSEIVDLSLDSEFPLMKVTRYHLLLGIFSYLIVCKILYLGLKMANKVCTRYV